MVTYSSSPTQPIPTKRWSRLLWMLPKARNSLSYKADVSLLSSFCESCRSPTGPASGPQEGVVCGLP